MARLTMMDIAALHSYKNDLEDATPAQIRDWKQQSENKIEEEEPWLEALVARQQLDRLTQVALGVFEPTDKLIDMTTDTAKRMREALLAVFDHIAHEES